MDIQKRLFELEDKDYAAFQSKLVPNIDSKLIIGVRVPVLRKFAKELIKDGFDGLLCEINDAGQMSEKLAKMLQDEAKMGEFAKNARVRLNEFSVEQIYKKWLELLRLGGVK